MEGRGYALHTPFNSKLIRLINQSIRGVKRVRWKQGIPPSGAPSEHSMPIGLSIRLFQIRLRCRARSCLAPCISTQSEVSGPWHVACGNVQMIWRPLLSACPISLTLVASQQHTPLQVQVVGGAGAGGWWRRQLASSRGAAVRCRTREQLGGPETWPPTQYREVQTSACTAPPGALLMAAASPRAGRRRGLGCPACNAPFGAPSWLCVTLRIVIAALKPPTGRRTRETRLGGRAAHRATQLSSATRGGCSDSEL